MFFFYVILLKLQIMHSHILHYVKHVYSAPCVFFVWKYITVLESAHYIITQCDAHEMLSDNCTKTFHIELFDRSISLVVANHISRCIFHDIGKAWTRC